MDYLINLAKRADKLKNRGADRVYVNATFALLYVIILFEFRFYINKNFYEK